MSDQPPTACRGDSPPDPERYGPPAGAPALTHIAGLAMMAHGAIRLRCLWCGMCLIAIRGDEEDLASVVLAFPQGDWVEAVPGEGWQTRMMRRDDELPANACTRRPAALVPPAGGL